MSPEGADRLPRSLLQRDFYVFSSHRLAGWGEAVCSWSRSATSPLEAAASSTLDLQSKPGPWNNAMNFIWKSRCGVQEKSQVLHLFAFYIPNSSRRSKKSKVIVRPSLGGQFSTSSYVQVNQFWLVLVGLVERFMKPVLSLTYFSEHLHLCVIWCSATAAVWLSFVFFRL